MANNNPTVTQTQSLYGHAIQVAWIGMANGDVGAGPLNSDPYIRAVGAADRSIQIEGTFGAGGTVVVEGTNASIDPTVAAPTWYTLRDALGNNLSFTSAGLKSILEHTAAIRVRVTAGDGTTSINAYLSARSTL